MCVRWWTSFRPESFVARSRQNDTYCFFKVFSFIFLLWSVLLTHYVDFVQNTDRFVIYITGDCDNREQNVHRWSSFFFFDCNERTLKLNKTKKTHSRFENKYICLSNAMSTWIHNALKGGDTTTNQRNTERKCGERKNKIRTAKNCT